MSLRSRASATYQIELIVRHRKRLIATPSRRLHLDVVPDPLSLPFCSFRMSALNEPIREFVRGVGFDGEIRVIAFERSHGGEPEPNADVRGPGVVVNVEERLEDVIYLV